MFRTLPALVAMAVAGTLTGCALGPDYVRPDARVIELVRDYRSTPQVVGLANAVMRRRGVHVELRAQQIVKEKDLKGLGREARISLQDEVKAVRALLADVAVGKFTLANVGLAPASPEGAGSASGSGLDVVVNAAKFKRTQLQGW